MTPIEPHGRGHRAWGRLSFARHHLREPERDPQELDADVRTERVLEGLPSADWSVVGHLEQRAGRTSQVVVGSAGVYLIVACKPNGCVRVRDGVPWTRRDADSRAERAHTDINRSVLEPVQALERQLRARDLSGPPVRAVVVLWSEFPQRVAETRRITFVHGRDLAAWLRRDGAALDEESRARAAALGEIVQRLATGRTRRTLRRRHARAA